jgi:hypothetical protein
MYRLVFVPLAACLALAACQDEPAEDSEGAAAMGEVLEGSISDDMIPLGELRSQPPMAPPEPVAGAGGATAAADGEEAAADEAPADGDAGGEPDAAGADEATAED